MSGYRYYDAFGVAPFILLALVSLTVGQFPLSNTPVHGALFSRAIEPDEHFRQP